MKILSSKSRELAGDSLFGVMFFFFLYSSVFDVWHSLTVLDWCSEVLGEWHTTSWESCEPEKVFQAVNDSANLVITPTVGLQRRTLTCISANASVLPPRLLLISFQNTFYIYGWFFFSSACYFLNDAHNHNMLQFAKRWKLRKTLCWVSLSKYSRQPLHKWYIS